MARLIQVTRAGNNTSSDDATELTINTHHIVLVEDNIGRDEGTSRIVLSNGKTILVEESQDDIRELANVG